MIELLISILVIMLIAYIIIYVIQMIPGLPPPAIQIARIIVGLIALLAILQRALPLLGVHLRL